MTEIQRLAIVNRGEPAIRALNAVAELNRAGDRPPITTVVLYTDPDARSWFVREADEAVNLGSATYVDESGHRRSRYLDEVAVTEALVAARIDAVWVGWGFVAESESFARRCEEAGIVFVGPDSATIRLLGDKVAAKRLAEECGVPVVPWSGGPVEDPDEAAKVVAERLHYPVVVKAASGGGGRGIRVVEDPADLSAALASASGEARLAFGDPTVFLEQMVPAARHVEVQVIADGYGTVWAVGVRDCSIQRRHQKVIEESASTALDAATEREIREAAVRLTRAAGYRNAGTVEFLVDPDGEHFLFMEVNTRLQVEHPVTEMTTGFDLVKAQLHVAGGGRLEGSPPEGRGHALEARLCAEDPEHGFAPAPGRLAELTLPFGFGVRIDAGVREGDEVAAEYDSMIAKIIAWGPNRDDALARLRRALAQTAVVVEGGATNRSFLLRLLDQPEVREGRLDNHWLDRLTAAGGHLPDPDPLAVLAAAVEIYEVEHAAAQATFRARAARGGPESPDEVGHTCRLRYRGVPYAVHVYRTGPNAYRVDTGGSVVDLTVERQNRYERRMVVAGNPHRVVAVVQGPTVRVEIDGNAHQVARDDGGVVRAAWSTFVVSVAVSVGDRVAAGDPVAVVESMKMESTLTAPFAGEVVSVEVSPNTQVDAGAALLRLRPDAAVEAVAETSGAPVDFTELGRPVSTDAPPCQRVYGALGGYLLGYDLDPAGVRRLAAEQGGFSRLAPPGDADLLHCEDGLLDLFADVSALYRPRTDTAEAEGVEPEVTQEYLLSYLQWLDADRAGLPTGYRERLERALRRYGVDGLARTPDLEQAVFWMFRSFSRVGELVGVVATILRRRLAHREELARLAGPDMRARLDRLAAAAQGRYDVVAELARDARFQFLDEPLLDAVVEEGYAMLRAQLAALRADPWRADRDDCVQRLVEGPQPLRGLLHESWRQETARTGADPAVDAFRRALLEVYALRFYRIRDLRELGFAEPDGRPLASAEYDLDHEKLIHLVVAYTPLAELPALSRAIATHLRDADPGRGVVVDLDTWRDGERPDSDTLLAQAQELLRECDFGRRLHRLDLSVTSSAGPAPVHLRTQHLTLRQHEDGRFVEDRLYRNLHPMLAKRLDLWRLSNFALERLRSAEDVYLFRGVAHDNPADRRLFALAEVRDLTPVRDARGIVTYPRLELTGLRALAAMHDALAAMPVRDRPVANRIVLYVRPPWTVPAESWVEVARSFAPLAVGAGLEKVVLRVQIPQPDGELRESVLHLEQPEGRAVTVRERPLGDEPLKPLTPYRQKVLRAARFGAPYPYEIVRMLTPPADTVAPFPAGRFVEHDLDEHGVLVPVDRPYGTNRSNIVTGLITNDTAKVPTGMTRVAVLGDPTRGLGNLAEPECQRIMAALDLAERLRVPLEWFAVSSGARIAMDSGTENMDWISAVLRRLIEFTQGGGEVNIIVTGVNVGAQPYWNAEATMLMHTRGILIMTPNSAMVLTGKQALDFSGGVSAEDNFGIGGFDRIMGPNGQGQYWAANMEQACQTLLRHYEHTYVVPGERYPRRATTIDPADRDVRDAPHAAVEGVPLKTVGDIFSAEHNPERKKPFDIRSVLRAVTDTDSRPLERWARWRSAEIAVVWDAHIGGIPVCLVGLESHALPRRGFVAADGPTSWTSGTLFPQSSRKVARAINGASGNRPLVVLANLSGFDGSPESMRRWQLEYGAEIGRAITNFRGPIVFVVISRYHGGAFVVFSKRLNERMEIAAVEGSYASVIGGAPAAATVFAREVKSRTESDPRVVAVREELAAASDAGASGTPGDADVAALRTRLAEVTATVRAERLGQVADEFDAVHTIQRAQRVGSVDLIIPAERLRPYVIDALERGMAADSRAPHGASP